MSETGISLEQLLASRDLRRQRQLEILERNIDSSLVLLTIVMPGAVKRNHHSLTCAEAALEALRNAFGKSLRSVDTYDNPTGYEAFLLVDLPIEECKRRACDIEDTHPLGRLFDIDVIGSDAIPVSRRSLGLPARRCLVCGDDARVCMRTNKHSYDDLLDRISEMVNDYERKHL